MSQWWGSGFIPIINYGPVPVAPMEGFSIITESGNHITTELSQRLITEDPST